MLSVALLVIVVGAAFWPPHHHRYMMVTEYYQRTEHVFEVRQCVCGKSRETVTYVGEHFNA